MSKKEKKNENGSKKLISTVLRVTTGQKEEFNFKEESNKYSVDISYDVKYITTHIGL